MSDKRRKLNLKRPKSGIFVNETPRPTDSEIPYETYDPRKLQAKLESEARKKYTLLSDGERLYFPWLPEEEPVQEPEQDPNQDTKLDQIDSFRQDCLNFMPVVFPIPDDLQKTFRAAVVFATGALPPYVASAGDRRPTEVACLFAAYVESFRVNPDYWSASTMDSLLKAGEELRKRSKVLGYEDLNSDFDILPELTKKKALIRLKLHLTGPLRGEPNILKALTIFFGNFNAGILCCETLYFLVWKRCQNTFYIFDPNGRDILCKRDFREGFASLMAVHTIEHVVHLVLNYSNVKPDADFSLYAIHLREFGKLSKPYDLPPNKKPPKLYAVVNSHFAVIPALSGINTPPPKSKADNPSMMVSFLGFVYSQVDPPKLWTMQLVDDLIKFGRQYYANYLAINRLKSLNVTDLPEVLLFGNYRALVEKRPFVEAGHIVDCWSYRASQLSTALKKFLEEYSSGLLQVDSSTFAIWRDACMIYVLDCFKRGPSGQAVSNPKPKAGCLQIHLTVESLCRIMFMNAVAVKQEGNFFIHAIRVKAIGTFSVRKAMEGRTDYLQLRIKYPFDCEKPKISGEEVPEEVPADGQKSGPGHFSLVHCLLELSVRPCGRTCSDRDYILQQQVLKRTRSIQSIPSEYRIPDFDGVDVIDALLGEVICDTMERIVEEPDKKKIQKRKPKTGIEASKILLQSDRGHLEELKFRVKHGEDFDNISVAFPTKPKPYQVLTLQEELAMSSNFTKLADGSWAIFGHEDVQSSLQSLKGILAVLCAALLSAKYKVSTWSSDVIEYAAESGYTLETHFLSYEHTLELIFRQQIPKIKLGSNTFLIRVQRTDTVRPERLKTTLEDVLLKVPRVLLICKGLSCLILRRYNFTYMFMGCPCDPFGFRSEHGPMCLLRCVEVTSLIRRIESACAKCSQYVLVALEVKDLTQPREQFWPHSASQENVIYSREMAKRRRFKEKLDFLEHEIKKESKRVREFQRQKGTLRTDFELDDEGEEALFDESEQSDDFKHKPGRSLEPPEEEDEPEDAPAQSIQGYQIKDADFHFKIQGTIALEGRNVAAVDEIKSCFFTSTVALLYSILRPINHWDTRRVDKVIHIGRNIAAGTSDLKTSTERFIKNVDADEFTFHIKVETFTPQGTFGGSLEYTLTKTCQQKKHFLFQISNCTFAIHHDQYFHIFDPYPSMDVLNPGEKPAANVADGIPLFPEQNTASWVLLPDLSAMIRYIGQRAASADWRDEYQLHTVSIVDYKMAPKQVQLLNLLTDEHDSCAKSSPANLCTHPEEMEWLDIYPSLVAWSRLNQTNAVMQLRGAPLTRARSFDVEIPDRLYSLWGSLHPESGVFGDSRGKQHLAICVVACCVANVYQVHEWNTQILDSIVIHGNDYHNESVSTIRRRDYEISIEHLNTVFRMGHLQFEVHVESVTYGHLYTIAKNEMNLAAALTFFFTHHRYGIVQCQRRCVAIGKFDEGFFMFDCQSHGLPLFHSGEGAAYVLRTTQLQILLYCIVMTFNLSYFDAQFTIHKVEMRSEEIAEQDEEEEEAD